MIRLGHRHYFWAGFLVCASLHSLFADYHGKEGFIAYCQNNWVSGWFTVPLAIFNIILVLVVLYLQTKKKKDGQ